MLPVLFGPKYLPNCGKTFFNDWKSTTLNQDYQGLKFFVSYPLTQIIKDKDIAIVSY